MNTKTNPKPNEAEIQKILSDAYRDYEKGLNQHSFFKIHDHNLSQDLVQDTFMKAWKYLVKGGKIDLMKAFLYHVLNNLIVDEYRKQKNKASSLDSMLENGFDQSTGDHNRILDILDGGRSMHLMNELPEKYRKVLHMRYIQGLSLEEMSVSIGQPKNTLAVQVHRGIEKLKALHRERGQMEVEDTSFAEAV